MADDLSSRMGMDASATGQINIPQAQPAQMQSPQGDIARQLMQYITQRAGQVQQQAQPIMGQYIPKQYGPQQGAPFANPNTREGQMANLGKSVGQAIGGAVSQYAERKEMQKAQNIAMDMQRLSDAITNPTPENKAMAEEILTDDKRRNEISKTMNIQFMGDDKRKPYQKVANQLFHKRQEQQKQQQLAGQRLQQQQQQQQGQTPYFNQMQRMMPQMPGIDPQTMVQAQLIKMGYSPKAGEVLDAFGKMATNEVNWERSVMTMGWQNARTTMMRAIEEARLRGIEMSDETKKIVAGINSNASAYRAGLQLKGQLARAGATLGAAQIGATSREKVAGIKAKSAEEIQKEKTEAGKLKLSLDTQVKGYSKQIDAKTKQLQDADKTIDKLQGQVVSKTQQAELNTARTNKMNLQAEINELNNSLQNVTNFSKYMEKQEGQQTTGPMYGPGSQPANLINQIPTLPSAAPSASPEDDDDEENQAIYDNASHNF